MSESSFKWSVIGNKTVVEYLQRSVLAGNLAHAYLFFGPTGVGKATLVKDFVNSMFCDSKTACGQCSHCLQINNNIHPDVTWINKVFDDKTGRQKKNIGIEQIRYLQGRLSLRSFLNSYKVAIIDEAESLSEEAANSLLKVLEEPSEKTILILISSNFRNIPETIISRCQTFEMLPVAYGEIAKYLMLLGAEQKEARQLALAAYGRPGLAISYLKEKDLFAEYKSIASDFIKLHQVDLLARFNKISQISNFSDAAIVLTWLDVWLKVLRDLVLFKNGNQGVVSNIFLLDDLNQVSNMYTNEKIVEVLRELNLARSYIYGNVNPKLILENLILSLPV